MKTILLLLLLSVSSACCYGQKVTLKGRVFTTQKDDGAWVSVNTSWDKLFDPDREFKRSDMRIVKNKNRMQGLKNGGEFKIKAKATDSIYFASQYHTTQAYLISDLAKQKNIRIKLEEYECEKYKECKGESRFYVFIGEKIKVSHVKYKECRNTIVLDREEKYKAKYKILDTIYGNYPNDTITFTLSNSYREPEFTSYKKALLYIEERCGKLFYLSYMGSQFPQMYRTKDNRWAVPCPKNLGSFWNMAPQAVDFAESVEFELKDMSEEQIAREYPEPYYKINGDKAIAIYGYYVEDIINSEKHNNKRYKNLERVKEILNKN